jgi:hypothetical protein
MFGGEQILLPRVVEAVPTANRNFLVQPYSLNGGSLILSIPYIR